MPVLLVLAFATLVMLAAVALMPLSVIQRYRMGTSRRLARGWIVGLNAWGMFFSTCFFLATAAVTRFWVPGAFMYAALGVASGALLGFAGLALTRWERPSPASLYYTPNRLLVLAITLVISARLFYGLWRAWHAWGAAADTGAWLAAAGVAGSLAAGGVVLGYYTTYWAGVRSRMRR